MPSGRYDGVERDYFFPRVSAKLPERSGDFSCGTLTRLRSRAGRLAGAGGIIEPGVDVPDVAERVGDRAEAVAVRLVLDLAHRRPARGHGAREDLVDVGNVHHDVQRRAAQRL